LKDSFIICVIYRIIALFIICRTSTVEMSCLNVCCCCILYAIIVYFIGFGTLMMGAYHIITAIFGLAF